MVKRTLTLLLTAAALSASANCFAADQFTFLEPKQVELLKIVPPPPPPNSEAQKQDIAAVLEA